MQVQNIQPIDSTCLFPVDDTDCPAVGDENGDKYWKVGSCVGSGNAVHDGGLLADQAEVPSHRHPLPPDLHTFQPVALQWMDMCALGVGVMRA